ncbi:hypothetical protein GGX14DRAFT_388065 [Mycena pura]|uniref:Uncharacterized protein n=1 Tax=Mycena pura TaxID=153505 RepID=A0AAD6YKD6_9AGAR|nr:hypothetical protein GGX14DRAFT_388065 [Mycena pura]
MTTQTSQGPKVLRKTEIRITSFLLAARCVLPSQDFAIKTFMTTFATVSTSTDTVTEWEATWRLGVASFCGAWPLPLSMEYANTAFGPAPDAIFLHHVHCEHQRVPSVAGSGAQPSAASSLPGRGVHTGTPGWIHLGSQLDPGWSWSQADPICSLIWGPAEASVSPAGQCTWPIRQVQLMAGW